MGHMNELELLASDLGTSVWTLRRAARSGLIRARRHGPRRLDIDSDEIGYLCENWSLLGALRASLRTEPGVRLAVLFGSVARGSAHADSDVDLLVVLDDERRLADVGARLSDATGRRISLSLLSDLERHPSILSEVLRDARVLVDRAGLWPALARQRDRIDAAGRRELRRLRDEAHAALAELSEVAVTDAGS